MSIVEKSPAPAEGHEPRRSGRRHHARGFWIVGAVFASTIAFAGAPAPLYVLYQARDGFGSFAITLIFAAYALGVVVSLFLVGHLSDRFGRLRLLAPAVLLNVLAGLIFLTWQGFPELLLARFVSGLGIGMLTATATAHMTELHLRSARAGRAASTNRAEVVSTAANIGGIGLGPLVAGILADDAPAPLRTPYLVFLFVLVLGLLLVVTVPETVAAVDSPWRYRPQRIAVPKESRGTYAAAAMAGFVSFAMFGFFTSLAPSLLSARLHVTSHTLAGIITFLVFGSAALTQIVTGRWRGARQYAIGVVLLAAGLIVVTVAVLAASLPLLILGGIATGIGAGASFKAAVGAVIGITTQENRGEALAGLFLIGYLGISVPVVLLGILLQILPTGTAVVIFGAVMLALLLLTTAVLRRAHAARAT